MALADGAHAIPLQNGKFLIIIGGASSTVANIYDPSAVSGSRFTAHPTAITAGGSGRHSIMRYDGKWQLISGGARNTDQFDTSLPMTGTYISDDATSTTALNARSTLRWTAQLESVYNGTNSTTNTAFSTMQFLTRTAAYSGGSCTTPLNSASDKELAKSGDLIQRASGDNCIRITVKFNRAIPKRLMDERGTWTGNGSTVLRLDYVTPTLFDITVDNGSALRRNNFEFNFPSAGSASPQNDPSGPILSRAEAQSDRVYLPFGRLSPTVLVGTTGFYQGNVGNAHPYLLQATTDGTVVIKRPDNTFLIIAGGGASNTNVMLYDPATSTFTAYAASISAITGSGAHTIKRPDGTFLIIRGGSVSNTHIYSPQSNTFSTGPNIPAGVVGTGAGSILNRDGTFTIVEGGAISNTAVYDPVRNTMTAGPFTTTVANCGMWAIPLAGDNDGIYRVFPGVAASTVGVNTTMLYNSISKIFSAGPNLTAIHGCGSYAFQRADNAWVTVPAQAAAGAGSSGTNILDPLSNTTLAGPTINGVVA